MLVTSMDSSWDICSVTGRSAAKSQPRSLKLGLIVAAHNVPGMKVCARVHSPAVGIMCRRQTYIARIHYMSTISLSNMEIPGLDIEI